MIQNVSNTHHTAFHYHQKALRIDIATGKFNVYASLGNAIFFLMRMFSLGRIWE